MLQLIPNDKILNDNEKSDPKVQKFPMRTSHPSPSPYLKRMLSAK